MEQIHIPHRYDPQAARVLKAVDSRTGNITLHGTGTDRLSQALAAGLVAEEVRSDVESVKRENTSLRHDVTLCEAYSRERTKTLRKYQAERLAGYMEASKRDMQRKWRRESCISDIAFGFGMVGIVVGGAIMTIAAVMVI